MQPWDVDDTDRVVRFPAKLSRKKRRVAEAEARGADIKGKEKYKQKRGDARAIEHKKNDDIDYFKQRLSTEQAKQQFAARLYPNPRPRPTPPTCASPELCTDCMCAEPPLALRKALCAWRPQTRLLASTSILQ